MKKVLVPIAHGSEEIESVCIIDTLRRAGADVTVASVETELIVTCARGTKLVADVCISDCRAGEWDCIACPGGMPGAEHLRDCVPLTNLLLAQKKAGKLYAAICATPVVTFLPHGLLEGREATAHPSMADDLKPRKQIEKRVVTDDNVVTSRGPGTAIEFALALIEHMYGKEKAQDVSRPMLVHSE